MPGQHLTNMKEPGADRNMSELLSAGAWVAVDQIDQELGITQCEEPI